MSPYRASASLFRSAHVVCLFALLLSAFAADRASASDHAKPSGQSFKTGLYKGTTGQGSRFSFRVVHGSSPLCHSAAGLKDPASVLCYVQANQPPIDGPCDDGETFHGYFQVFDYVIPKSGKLTKTEYAYSPPLTAPVGSKTLSLAIQAGGRASGYIRATDQVANGSTTPPKCDSGKVRFTAKISGASTRPIAERRSRTCGGYALYPNLKIAGATNMTCTAAREVAQRINTSISFMFSIPGGFECKRISGGRLAGRWSCKSGKRSFRFDFSD